MTDVMIQQLMSESVVCSSAMTVNGDCEMSEVGVFVYAGIRLGEDTEWIE